MPSIIKPLSGIRGIAVLLVVLSHASYHELHLFEWLDFNGLGKVGVFIFFVLSAFLLTYKFLAGNTSLSAIFVSLPSYLSRRFFRIFPLYVTGLLASVIISHVYAPFYVDSIASFFRHLALLDGNGTFWTIPVEFGYYLILPTVAAMLLSWKRHPFRILAALAMFIPIWQLLFPPAYEAAVFNFLSVFLMGSGAAYFYHHLGNGAHQDLTESTGFRAVATVAAVLSLVAVALLTPSLFGYLTGQALTQDHFHHDFVLLGLVSTGLVLGAAWSFPTIQAMFSSRPLVYLGKISFSIYIWHIFVANALGLMPEIPDAIRFLAYLSLTWLISHFSYRLIEKPTMGLTLPTPWGTTGVDNDGRRSFSGTVS